MNNSKHVIINSIRNQIDYVTRVSRHWIEEGEWDMANIYIDKAITLQEKHDKAVKMYQHQVNPKQTLIID